jgi:hypothetical protein
MEFSHFFIHFHIFECFANEIKQTVENMMVNEKNKKEVTREFTILPTVVNM